MRNLRVILAASAGLAAAVAVACGSSSSNPGSTTPDGGDDSASVDIGDDANGAGSCLPLMASGLCPGQGNTCCFDISKLGGTCMPAATCATPIQVGCLSQAQCGSQVCCADFGAGGLGALVEAGLGIDAAAVSADAGISAIAGMLGNLNLKLACAASCTASQIQTCTSDAECGGGTCVALTTLLADAGSAFGDAGIPAGFAMYASALGMDMACVPPAVDASAPLDAETATDTGMSDAVAPADAPSDAVSE